MWQTSHKIRMTHVSSYCFNELIYMLKRFKETTFANLILCYNPSEILSIMNYYITGLSNLPKINIWYFWTDFYIYLNHFCCTPSLLLIIVRIKYLLLARTIYYIVCMYICEHLKYTKDIWERHEPETWGLIAINILWPDRWMNAEFYRHPGSRWILASNWSILASDWSDYQITGLFLVTWP